MQPYRLNAPTSDDLDTTVSEHLVANTQASVVLQFSSPEQYPAHLLKRVDALCSQYGERINVRFWGHFAGQPFDATTLLALPNVQSLSLTSLRQVIALETLGALEHLKRLQIGILDVDLNPIVALANLQALHSLGLSQEQGAKVDLSPLHQMRNLQSLTVSVRNRGLEALEHHPSIKELSLYRQPATTTFEGVGTLPRLESLAIGFGSRAAMPELDSESVRHLSLVRVRGLSQFDLACCPNLRTLRIEDQPHLASLALESAPQLTDVRLLNLKALARLSGLSESALTHLCLINTPQLDLLKLLEERMPALVALKLYAGKRTLDAQIAARQNELGIGGVTGPF